MKKIDTLENVPIWKKEQFIENLKIHEWFTNDIFIQ